MAACAIAGAPAVLSGTATAFRKGMAVDAAGMADGRRKQAAEIGFRRVYLDIAATAEIAPPRFSVEILRSYTASRSVCIR